MLLSIAALPSLPIRLLKIHLTPHVSVSIP